MPPLDPLNIGLIVVTVITAFGAWATQRSASRANRLTAREQAELDAYNRARKMDLETIQRQDAEFDELRGKYLGLKKRVDELEEENGTLRHRITTIERKGRDAG